jgi:hypothetical protein
VHLRFIYSQEKTRAPQGRATMTMPQLPRSQQEEVPAGPAPVAGLKRRAQSLPAVGRPQHAVTAFVSPSAPSSPPRRSSPPPAAATVVEAADLVEFVTVALNLANCAHDGIQRGPAATRRCEPPPAASSKPKDDATQQHGSVRQRPPPSRSFASAPNRAGPTRSFASAPNRAGPTRLFASVPPSLPTATQERSPRRAAPEKCAARGDTVPGRPAAGRSDSGLSASATECGGDSPIPPQQPTPPCETPKLPSAAPGTASRNVPYRTLSRCWDHSVEQLHVAARLSAMRPARRQKLQSSID